MAMSLLGEQSDIHIGGTDLIFPHHENEIAICHALTGKSPAKYWIHSGLVMVEGRKMSRSTGNSVTVRDLLERGYTGRQIRFLLLNQHYRQPLHFSYGALDAAAGSLNRLDECVRNLRQVSGGDAHEDTALLVAELESELREALFDDLNISAAVAALFHFVRRVNRRRARGQLSGPDAATVLGALSRADAVLGLELTGPPLGHDEREQIEELVRRRDAARQAQDYATADALRSEIESKGAIVEDTPEGTRWRSRQ
jgi:cysteinyl-tRNA synthetase